MRVGEMCDAEASEETRERERVENFAMCFEMKMTRVGWQLTEYMLNYYF